MWAHKKMTARINILKQVDQFKDSDEQIQKYMCVVYPWTKRGARTISSTLPSAGRVSLAIEKYSWSVLTAWSRSNRSLMRRSPGCNAASTYSSLLVLSGWPALTAGSYHCMCRKSCVTDLAILLLQSSMCNCALQGLFCYSFNKQGRKKGTGGPQGHSAECPKFWTKQWSIYTYHISCLCVYTRTWPKLFSACPETTIRWPISSHQRPVHWARPKVPPIGFFFCTRLPSCFRFRSRSEQYPSGGIPRTN
jgi:hypothetical protein